MKSFALYFAAIVSFAIVDLKIGYGQLGQGNPPLNVSGDLEQANLFVLSPAYEWVPLEHGSCVESGKLCKATAEAIGNNNENFQVLFALATVINVAADETGEVEWEWGEGTRKSYRLIAGVYEDPEHSGLVDFKIAAAMEQNVGLSLDTSVFEVPQAVEVIPDFSAFNFMLLPMGVVRMR